MTLAVKEGVEVVKYLEESGPDELTKCSLKHYKSEVKRTLVTVDQPPNAYTSEWIKQGKLHSTRRPDESLTLTEEGEKLISSLQPCDYGTSRLDPIVYKLQLVCKGEGSCER